MTTQELFALSRQLGMKANGDQLRALAAAITREEDRRVTYLVWNTRETPAKLAKHPYALMTGLMGDIQKPLEQVQGVKMPKQRVCYIAHALGGPSFQANLLDLHAIVRQINLNEHDVIPFVPYYCDFKTLNDDEADQRARGLNNGHAILSSGVVDELWLTGDEVTQGMEAERELALRCGIKVVDCIGHAW